MEACLLADFGSTYTKLTAVDLENAVLLGTAQSYTTVETDIGDGLENALALLYQKTGKLSFTQRLACSSAAGGLRMVVSGLVAELTAEAARLASLGAGAKVVRAFSFHLTKADIDEIDRIAPDIFLLTGGIDGGNEECILHNANMLAACKARFPIVVAGNRNAADACARILDGRDVKVCENVLPKLGTLNIEPVQNIIRELFLSRIVEAKGLSKAKELLNGILMPTPGAMLKAMELLSLGTQKTEGLGELMALDLGGATTDVYTMAKGLPRAENVVLKGLPEPFKKRTVEGDIGMRYSAAGILEAAGMERLKALSGLEEEEIRALLEAMRVTPGILPGTGAQKALDDALAAAAIDIASARHAGRMEQVYTPMGPVYGQTGKDLTDVSTLVVTGGAIIHNPRAAELAVHALYTARAPDILKPRRATVYIDRKYILAAMGLLGEKYPDIAISIMKKELQEYGTVEQAPVQ